jgi:anti-anti-sigma factor
MSASEFQHIRLSMLNDDIILVELLTRDLQGPTFARQFGAELREVVQKDSANRLLVNFRRVRRLCSTGFAVLFGVVRQVKETGRQIKFCGMTPELKLGADVVGLTKVAEIVDDQETAVREFTPASLDHR